MIMHMYKKVYFEITNVCNLNCSFCPETNREKKFVSILNFKNIVKALKTSCEELSPHIVGEPFTHPDILEIFKICENSGLKINITTNGLRIKNFQDAIINAKAIRQINFSLQCFKDNFPDKSLKPYIEDILNFCVLASNVNPALYINLRLWNLEADEKGNELIICIIEDFFKIKINRTLDIRSIKSKKIWNNVSINFDSRFEWPSLDLAYCGEKGTCYGLTSHFGILVDGTVVPCCLDKGGVISLGNCFSESLSSILNSDRALKIKDGFEKNVLHEKLCQHCSYIKRFKKLKLRG